MLGIGQEKSNCMPNVSLICTVLNEENSIFSLLQSMSDQTRIPNEVLFVDGGSTDKTVSKLKKAKKQFPQLNIKIIVQKSNRSEGRNIAIKNAKYESIAITDAGCTLDPQWLYELVKKQLQTGADVIAGYYRAEPKTPFEEAVIPYTLVMPDRVDPLNFLPATRSMLISKKAFKKAGGFNSNLNVSEDYEFAHRLKAGAFSIVFAHEATVVWYPRKTVSSFFTMVASMAAGDAKANVIRPKVYLVFMRYFVFTSLYFVNFSLLIVLLLIYTFWAIYKNHTYVSVRALPWLGVLQYVADVGVVLGTLGIIK